MRRYLFSGWHDITLAESVASWVVWRFKVARLERFFSVNRCEQCFIGWSPSYSSHDPCEQHLPAKVIFSQTNSVSGESTRQFWSESLFRSSGSPYKSGSSHITSQVWLGFDLNSEAQAFNCLTRLNSRGPVSTSNLPQSIDHWLLN